jgi:hypothetical protein
MGVSIVGTGDENRACDRYKAETYQTPRWRVATEAHALGNFPKVSVYAEVSTRAVRLGAQLAAQTRCIML